MSFGINRLLAKDIKCFRERIDLCQKFQKIYRQKNRREIYKGSFMKSIFIKLNNFKIRKLLYSISGMKGYILLKRIDKL